MEHFKLIKNMDEYDFWTDWQLLLAGGEIAHLPEHGYEVCLNTTKKNSTDCYEGAGSLNLDWSRKKWHKVNGVDTMFVPMLAAKDRKTEEEFLYLCEQFKGTEFQKLWDYLGLYKIGRVKLFRSLPKTCLTWHRDACSRLHFPVETHPGCKMVIEDEVLHMEKGKWYWADTTKQHTAFNASKQLRYHVVVGILDDEEFKYTDV